MARTAPVESREGATRSLCDVAETASVSLVFLDELASARPELAQSVSSLSMPTEQHRYCLPVSAVLEKSRLDPSRRTFAILIGQVPGSGVALRSPS